MQMVAVYALIPRGRAFSAVAASFTICKSDFPLVGTLIDVTGGPSLTVMTRLPSTGVGVVRRCIESMAMFGGLEEVMDSFSQALFTLQITALRPPAARGLLKVRDPPM